VIARLVRTGAINQVAASPDDRYVVTCANDESTAFVWDFATGTVVFRVPVDNVSFAQFSRDGSQIAFTEDRRKPDGDQETSESTSLAWNRASQRDKSQSPRAQGSSRCPTISVSLRRIGAYSTLPPAMNYSNFLSSESISSGRATSKLFGLSDRIES
jgi:WD40 repeat protein